MDVSELLCWDSSLEDIKETSVETHGYKIEGTILNKEMRDNLDNWKNLKRLTESMCLNNESYISKTDSSSSELNVNGSSTELAIRVLSEKLEKLRDPSSK